MAAMALPMAAKLAVPTPAKTGVAAAPKPLAAPAAPALVKPLVQPPSVAAVVANLSTPLSGQLKGAQPMVTDAGFKPLTVTPPVVTPVAPATPVTLTPSAPGIPAPVSPGALPVPSNMDVSKLRPSVTLLAPTASTATFVAPPGTPAAPSTPGGSTTGSSTPAATVPPGSGGGTSSPIPGDTTQHFINTHIQPPTSLHVTLQTANPGQLPTPEQQAALDAARGITPMPTASSGDTTNPLLYVGIGLVAFFLLRKLT